MPADSYLRSVIRAATAEEQAQREERQQLLDIDDAVAMVRRHSQSQTEPGEV